MDDGEEEEDDEEYVDDDSEDEEDENGEEDTQLALHEPKAMNKVSMKRKSLSMVNP